ncbi:OLC1v1024196C1 [Oldenlandia corymbosa var. corymbosa]|uniref:OLC1v1024196C1 n=1 Tax=Oldenlandia corymbosa var. corymbosa TaxID=529605 RepID=A0AAV1C425_OLDCO|nr:OLC1v1024196C1 [Oldenlandia corymbosa var. corymbosa]
MSFTETVKCEIILEYYLYNEPDGTITVQRDAPDGYLIFDRMLDFSELVDKVCGVMEVDREGLYIDFSLVWTERSGKELYPENVERTCHVYASSSGQDIGASTSGGRTVEDNEDGDEDGDEDEDKDEDADEDEDEDGGGVESSDDEYVPLDEDSNDDTDFESSSSVPYVFDDISGWDKTLEEVDCDGVKMWDGNPLTLGLDIHFANKPEAQAAVGEWNLVHGRTFRVKTSSKRTWYIECETCGPKYPKEHLHGYDCLWKARVLLQKATDTWKMVANIDMIQKCQTVLPPKPMKLYEEARKKSLRQKVNRFSKRNQKYEVVTIAPDNQPWKAEEKQVVLYANRECTCGRWQTFRFPCSHALRVARELGDDPFPLFDPCYTTHQWYQQFSGEFNLIMELRPKAKWQIRPDDTKLVHHAGRGRKRVNRKKGVMDYTSKSGQRRLQTCSLSYLERMFGFRFQTEESRLTSVSITEIKTHIENNPLTDLSPDDAHLQRARCFVGWLVGGLLFSNTTRNSFPLDLVHFLHTPEICSEYSWGSAALCYLYRSMSKSSLAASAKAITGCVILLQLWAWERILTVQPRYWVGISIYLIVHWARDPEYLLWYHQVTVKYVTDPTDSENARGFHGSAETLRLMTRPSNIHHPDLRGHEQSHIPFTGGSSHQSPHQSPLHSRQHSAHQSPHHSSPTQQAFYHFSAIRLMTQLRRHEEQGSSQTLGTPPLAKKSDFAVEIQQPSTSIFETENQEPETSVSNCEPEIPNEASEGSELDSRNDDLGNVNPEAF